MTNNNVFNMSRFGRLFIKHTTEHYKTYLMSLSVLAGVMALGGCFIVFLMPGGIFHSGFQAIMYINILLLAGSIFASTIFADLGEKKKAMSALILPASHLEKYLVAFIYAFLIFFIVYTGIFYLIALFLTHLKPVPGEQTEVVNIFNSRITPEMYLTFVFIQSLAFYGAILYEKLHFIKTAFVFFIGIGVLICVNKLFLSALIGVDALPSAPFGNLRFFDHNRESFIALSSHRNTLMLYLLGITSALFLIAAYYRLKEKQI